MAKIFRRKGLSLLSGILCLLASGIVVAILINDPHKPDTRPWSAWVQANFSRTIEANGVHQVFEKTGWTYFGLFKGYKVKSYSANYQGLRTKYYEGKIFSTSSRSKSACYSANAPSSQNVMF